MFNLIIAGTCIPQKLKTEFAFLAVLVDKRKIRHVSNCTFVTIQQPKKKIHEKKKCF